MTFSVKKGWKMAGRYALAERYLPAFKTFIM